MPRVGSKQSRVLEAGGDPAGDHHLLHGCSPLRRLTCEAARVSICSFVTACAERVRRSAPMRIGTQGSPRPRKEASATFSIERCGSSESQSVRRHQHQTGADRIGGMTQLERDGRPP